MSARNPISPPRHPCARSQTARHMARFEITLLVVIAVLLLLAATFGGKL